MPAARTSPRSAVFLDALGTLVALEQPWPRFRAVLSGRHGVDIGLDAARRALLAEMDHYRRNCVRAADAASLAALRLDCARILREQLAPELAELADEEIVAVLLDSLRFAPYDDVLGALERWRAAGLTRVVVSNWDISLHDVLDATGLRPLVDGVVCSADVGASKPDPAVFVAALELAGARPEDVVHIGDSLEEDVAGARAAGIEPVLLNRDGGAPQTSAELRVIASLREC